MSDNTAAPTTTTLDLDSMIAAAREASGLQDFGELSGFEPRARRWLSWVEREGELGEQGAAGLQQQVIGWLVNRLRFAADLRKHPEIKDEVVRAPIVITGMPRTGTTKLQRILAAAPDNQGLPFWRILSLAPLPGSDGVEPDPRIEIAAGFEELLKGHNPEFLVGHPLGAEEPEEEGFVVEADFQALANCFRVRVPSYFDEIVESPDFESYSFLKLSLQYVQWQLGEAGQLPWVLKTVSHIGNLENLFRTFPDATVVHCYRDPMVAVPSMCKILELFRSLLQPPTDLHRHGTELLDLWAGMQRRHLAARQNPAIDARVVDAHFDDICNDTVGVAKAIYERAGRVLDPAAERRMRGWEADHPQHQSGRFEYSLERYGLTEDQVRAAFSEYIDRFDRVSTV